MFKIAFRNVFRQKRRTLLTISTMSGGFVLAAISIGWSDGTYNEVIDLFTRHRLGHIQIHAKDYLDRPSLYKTIDQPAQIGRRIARIAGVDSWAPRLHSPALASSAEKAAAVRIIGIDPLREENTTRWSRHLARGEAFSRDGPNEAILGKGLSRLLACDVGGSVILVSQGADGSIANDRYTVVGIADSGDETTDRTSCYLRLGDAQELLVLPGRVHELVVTVNRLDRVLPLAQQISELLHDPNLTVAAWQEFAEPFYQAMKADRKGMWIMLVVIMLVVAVGVLNTVLMAVLERQREYGVLKAIGTRPGQIFRLILCEVCLMALISVVLASPVALLANWLLCLYGIRLPEPISYGGVLFQTMHAEINLASFVIPTLTVVLTACLVAVLPAWKAMRTHPAHAMRKV